MKKLFSILTILCFTICGCKSLKQQKNAGIYQTRDYQDVGNLLPNTKAPYVIDLKNGQKELIFIGCDHSNNPIENQFAEIQSNFNRQKPQIAYNEGGQLSDSLHFESKEMAILQKGESGFLKFLSDSAGIKMLNGDISDSLEFVIMLKKYPKQDLFLYYIMERLIIPYLNKAYGNRPFEELYKLALQRWFIEPGFPLNMDERSLDYFKQLYQQKMGRPFVLEINKDNFEKFDYVNGGDCKYCQIGRNSKMTRDSVLLNKLAMALTNYDRVFVTFGLGHALAIEPALRQLMYK